MNNFGLSESALAILNSIFSNYSQVEKVLLFGSRAKGKHHARSDVDMVICNSHIDRYTFGKILQDINDSDFPYTVDLQVLENIQNPKLLEHIDQVGQMIYQKTTKEYDNIFTRNI